MQSDEVPGVRALATAATAVCESTFVVSAGGGVGSVGDDGSGWDMVVDFEVVMRVKFQVKMLNICRGKRNVTQESSYSSHSHPSQPSN